MKTSSLHSARGVKRSAAPTTPTTPTTRTATATTAKVACAVCQPASMAPSNPTLLEAKAAVYKALGHPSRLFIVEQLAGGERCVCEFVDALQVDFSTISKHLSVLKQAGIVADRKQGLQVYYSLKTPCILSASSCIETLLRQQLAQQSAMFAKV